MRGCSRIRFGPWSLALLTCGGLHGQQPVNPAPELPSKPPQAMQMDVPRDAAGLMTLHVYSNLIQMPVLVLGWNREPLKPIPPEKFIMNIDGGPAYKPTHVRLEGADPISIAILVDLGGSAKSFAPKLSDAVAALAPLGLTPHDHVTMYALDCSLWRTLDDAPVSPEILRDGMDRALTRFMDRRTQKHLEPCREKIHLWDAIDIALMGLAELPGRRVVVALTDGVDRGSSHSWRQVTDALQLHAVTAIALQPSPEDQAPRFAGGTRRPMIMTPGGGLVEDPLRQLCESSGGIVLTANRWNLTQELTRVPALLRGRYILEFPRPWNTTAGNHLISVEVAKSLDFIRVSGTSVPLPDPKLMADPTTVPNDPTRTPEMGKPRTPPPPK